MKKIPRGRTMAKCQFCGKETLYPFKCSYCDGIFCEDHRLPTKHECDGLTTWRLKAPPKGVVWEISSSGDSFRDSTAEEGTGGHILIGGIEEFIPYIPDRILPAAEPDEPLPGWEELGLSRKVLDSLYELPRKKYCYYCGKKLTSNDLVFICRNCELSFCEDHKLPEIHNCLGKRKYVLPPGIGYDELLAMGGLEEEAVVRCQFCGKGIKTIPFKCDYCEGLFCNEHRLPPSHECINLELWKKAPPPKKSHTIVPRRRYVIRSPSPPPPSYDTGEKVKPRKKRGKTVRNIALALIIAIVILIIYPDPLLTWIDSDLSLNKFTSRLSDVLSEQKSTPHPTPSNTLSSETTPTPIPTLAPIPTLKELTYYITLDASKFDTAFIEREILRFVNLEREKAGLKPYRWNDQVRAVAYNHSKDMGERNYFAHTSPEGKDHYDRLKESGMFFIASGEVLFYFENIQYNQTELARAAVEGWLKSPGHRSIVLNVDNIYSDAGVGVYCEEDRCFVTMNVVGLEEEYSTTLNVRYTAFFYLNDPGLGFNTTVPVSVKVESSKPVDVYIVPDKEQYERFLKRQSFKKIYYKKGTKTFEKTLDASVGTGIFVYSGIYNDAEITVKIRYYP